MSNGEDISCSAETVTLELMGDSVGLVDEELIRNAAQAVLHYFQNDLGQNSVSVSEFAAALERVLRGLGFDVKSQEASESGVSGVVDLDLRRIAREAGKGFELTFFGRLREEMRTKVEEAPQVLQFTGLRGCVKQLLGVRRWSGACQRLSDQIVEYLRGCLDRDRAPCAMVVR